MSPVSGGRYQKTLCMPAVALDDVPLVECIYLVFMYLWWSVYILYLTEPAVADSGLCFFVGVTPFYSYPLV